MELDLVALGVPVVITMVGVGAAWVAFRAVTNVRLSYLEKRVDELDARDTKLDDIVIALAELKQGQIDICRRLERLEGE